MLARMWEAVAFVLNVIVNVNVFMPLYAADRRRDARRSVLTCLVVFIFVVILVGLGVVLWQRVVR